MPDLIKKFFDTFKIEPKEITDSHYLDLICILNHIMYPDLGELYTEKLKRAILEQCIEALEKVDDWKHREPSKEEFIKEIQELFKGE